MCWCGGGIWISWINSWVIWVFREIGVYVWGRGFVGEFEYLFYFWIGGNGIDGVEYVVVVIVVVRVFFLFEN